VLADAGGRDHDSQFDGKKNVEGIAGLDVFGPD
jgi:hypothetical protein